MKAGNKSYQIELSKSMVNAISDQNIEDFIVCLGEALRIHLACCKVARKSGLTGLNSEIKSSKSFTYIEKH